MSIKKMFLFMSVISVLLLPAVCIGSPITVTSFRYDIILEYSGSPSYDFYGTYSYGGAGEGPWAAHSYVIPNYYGWNVDAEAVSASVSPFTIYLDTDNLEMDVSYAQATALWNFTPNYDKIKVDIGGSSQVNFGGSGGWISLSYSLIDITGNQLLMNGSSYFNPPYSDIYNPSEDGIDETFLFHVSQDRDYRLILFAETESYDNTNTNIWANFSTVPVPEPATMLLLASGFLWLAGMRRKFKKI